ncbi:MAG TPA: hypothetical protein VFG77_01210 [Nitrososphaeraceae archaeon]|nr:hypothetical protein [Nitrososphaeraceae archaeon]
MNQKKSMHILVVAISAGLLDIKHQSTRGALRRSLSLLPERYNYNNSVVLA